MMSQHDLGQVDFFTFTAEVQERQEVSEEDRPLFEVRVAVVKDLRQKRVGSLIRCCVGLEQQQGIHDIPGGSGSALVIARCRCTEVSQRVSVPREQSLRNGLHGRIKL